MELQFFLHPLAQQAGLSCPDLIGHGAQSEEFFCGEHYLDLDVMSHLGGSTWRLLVKIVSQPLDVAYAWIGYFFASDLLKSPL